MAGPTRPVEGGWDALWRLATSLLLLLPLLLLQWRRRRDQEEDEDLAWAG